MTDLRAFSAFILISVIWGSSWIVGKVAVSAVPPLFFISLRFIAAGGLLMLGLAALHLLSLRPLVLPPTGTRWRVAALAAIAVMTSPGLIFWGLVRTPSGMGAVVNMTLIPLSLYLFGLLLGEEKRRPRYDAALALGAFGLALLFAPRVMRGIEAAATDLDDAAVIVGLIAIVAGTFCYGLGAVLVRPAMQSLPPFELNAVTSLLGGAGLLLVSLVLEQPGSAELAALADPLVLACWLYFVVFASIVAHTTYLWLLRVWGPVRSGLYAFVAPIIAVIAGWAVLSERFGALEVAGMAAMLAATWIAIRPSREGASRS
ncbi:MAG: EamA family transporter [Alphaproteobacteria bacterium]|nr:EamA family transporter [Alphaproteobacteria bacterium]